MAGLLTKKKKLLKTTIIKQKNNKNDLNVIYKQ